FPLYSTLFVVLMHHFVSFFMYIPSPPRSTLFPYTTLFRSHIYFTKKYVNILICELASSIELTVVRYVNIFAENRILSLNKFLHIDRKSTRLNSSHVSISYAVFCLKKKISQAEHDVYIA